MSSATLFLPRRRPLPSYRHHKPTGQAVVTLNGRDHYLGRHGDAISVERYERLLATWLNNGRRVLPASDNRQSISVAELLAHFLPYAASYYVHVDGTPTGEYDNFRAAIRPLHALYSQSAASEFGPKALKGVRQKMIESGWCRTSINRNIARIRQIFRWAVAQELIPTHTYHGLQAVSGLKRGRTEAKESAPVRPVHTSQIDVVLPLLSRQVRAMVRLQLLTGARPGEICVMRPCDITTGEEVWTYTPADHKTGHHGHRRVIYLGPRAQEVVRPFLAGRAMNAAVFSPAEAERERHEAQRAARMTPVQPSQVARAQKRAGRDRRRAPSDCYDVHAYRRAIARACVQAGVTPAWHPHQLRHNSATEIRREFGIEIARILLGHRTAAITEIYAEQDQTKAKEVMRRVG